MWRSIQASPSGAGCLAAATSSRPGRISCCNFAMRSTSDSPLPRGLTREAGSRGHATALASTA